MAQNDGKEITRRIFVRRAGGALLAASSAGMTACSYARVLGANDRIHLAQLGCGSRSEGHMHMVSLVSKQMPVETVVVCDLWSMARERHAALAGCGKTLLTCHSERSEESAFVLNQPLARFFVAFGSSE